MPLQSIDFLDLITFTRSGGGTHFDSNGVMQTAGNNEPRFNHRFNGTIWEPAGFQVEGAATNLLVRSREFDTAGWAKADTTITANSINGVGGTATMDLCTEGSAGSAQVYQDPTISADTTNTFSVDLKRGNHDWVRLVMAQPGSANVVYGWVNLATGAAGSTVNGGTATGAAVTIRNLGDGIYRCILTGAINNGATVCRCSVRSATADASNTAVSGATRYQDRAQLEAGSVATSFILTEGSTQNRGAETALIDGTNFSSWFNPNEGTFVVEGDTAVVSTSMAFSVTDGTVSNRMQVNATATNAWYIGSGGVEQVAITLSAPTANTTFRRAVAYKENDFAASHNGGAVVTDTSGTVPSGLTQLAIGNRLGLLQLNGHIRSLRYYPTRLSDAQLVALSTL